MAKRTMKSATDLTRRPHMIDMTNKEPSIVGIVRGAASVPKKPTVDHSHWPCFIEGIPEASGGTAIAGESIS
jgi:hypothetical protein